METEKTDIKNNSNINNNSDSKDMTPAAVLIAAYLLTIIFAAAGFLCRSNSLIIGMFEDQRGFFDQKEILEAAVGRPVTFKYYDSIEEMKIDIASGELEIYVSPIFEFIASSFAQSTNAKAVATIEADYVLAARSQLGAPVQVGVTEKYISTILIRYSGKLDNKKISLQTIDASSRIPYINEGIIECAIFRGEIPEELSSVLETDIRLSDLGFKHDLLVVSNKLILKHDDLVRAIFSASSKISQRLPDETEIKNAEFFLFQIGEIKERKEYQHYVHIK